VSHEEFNEDMAINKISVIYLRDGEKNARICLKTILKKHPDSSLLRTIDEIWQEFVSSIEENLRLLNISNKTIVE